MKKTVKSIMASALCLALIGSSFAGCSGGGSSSTASTAAANSAAQSTASPDDMGESGASIVLWGSSQDQAMLKEMTAAFVKEHAAKNYKVEVRVQDEDKAKDAVLKDVDAAGDVFCVPHDQLGALAEAGACYPNTVYKDQIVADDSESCVKAATYKDTLYGYPRSVQSVFLYYNKSVFSEDDVKSLETMMAKAKAQNKGIGFDMGNNYNTAIFWFTNGCKLFGQNGTTVDGSTFNSPEGLQVAKYISTLKDKGVKDMTDGNASTTLKDGTISAQVTGSWKAKDYEAILGANYGVSKLPTINIGGSDKQMVSFAGYTLYLVKSSTKYPQASMQLAQYLTSEQNQVKAFKVRQVVPANKKAAADPSVTSDKTVAAQLAQAQFTIPMPSITQMANYWSASSMIVTKDIFNGKTKEADFQSALDKWSNVLKAQIAK
jgi:arabinogalactan oligomer/maltooligosaccharide transport system substrate-binding protein